MTTIEAGKSINDETIHTPEITPAIRVLLAEDEPHLGTILEQFLSGRGFNVTIVRNGAAALEKLKSEVFDVALLDIMMPEVDGLEVLRRVREDSQPPEIIIITGNGTAETAIAALKLGAYDFLTKPYRMAEIEALVRRAWEKRVLTRDNISLNSRLKRKEPESKFITQYAPLTAVLGLVDRVSSSSSPVLITGEFGTGKSLIARLLHSRGDRAVGPFVTLNCAALTETQFESELLGVERGALPGALARSLGVLELAAGGTLLFDRIGELDLKLQEKLQRLLEAGSFKRVGGSQKIDINARVVATSNRDLPRMVAAGLFRDELLQRVNTVRVALPPLRERAVDVALLAEYFLIQFSAAVVPRLTDEATSMLDRYRWPGNVRELRNVMERAALLSTGGFVEARDLPITSEVSSSARAAPAAPLTLSELERRHIQDVLDRTGWHQGRASELLGISPKTLYRKIREYGFHRPSRLGGTLDGN
ncbi:MAG: sigma-54 dependent transcriptional regulator [Gemmatimonadaceae bacterium]